MIQRVIISISEALLPEFVQETASARRMLERLLGGKFACQLYEKS